MDDIKQTMLEILNEWDVENLNNHMPKVKFEERVKSEIGEENTKLIDSHVRDLIEEGYVDILGTIGNLYGGIRLTKEGRDVLRGKI